MWGMCYPGTAHTRRRSCKHASHKYALLCKVTYPTSSHSPPHFKPHVNFPIKFYTLSTVSFKISPQMAANWKTQHLNTFPWFMNTTVPVITYRYQSLLFVLMLPHVYYQRDIDKFWTWFVRESIYVFYLTINSALWSHCTGSVLITLYVTKHKVQDCQLVNSFPTKGHHNNRSCESHLSFPFSFTAVL